jgi:hypothetical protein
MARGFCATLLFCGLSLTAYQAEALQITNRDKAEHKLVVTENGAAKDVVLKPAQSLDGFCLKGCTVKTADGEEYDFDGTEVVSIEEGLMFLDEPVEGGATGPGGEVGEPTTGGTDEPPAQEQPQAETPKPQ